MTDCNSRKTVELVETGFMRYKIVELPVVGDRFTIVRVRVSSQD